MTNEQMKQIIKYLIQIKCTNVYHAIDILLNDIDSSQRLEGLINELLELGTEQPQIRGL